MNENSFGIRDGEVAVDLPDHFDASLYFIGRIHTPWKERKDCPKNPRESDAVCTIELDPRWAPALKEVETLSHIIVLYWMDRSRRDLVLQTPRHYGEQRGTFALRSPARPNPIALSVARLVEHRRQQAQGGRARLPRRHAAPRHQALFRLDRRVSRRQSRLARRPAFADRHDLALNRQFAAAAIAAFRYLFSASAGTPIGLFKRAISIRLNRRIGKSLPEIPAH